MSLYKFLPALLLRTPSLSYSHYSSKDLKPVLKMPFFKNAIFLASKSFYKELQKKKFNYDLLDKKEINTLRKYANRMFLRPTPFGLFSAFAAVEWGNNDGVIINKHKIHFKNNFEKGIIYANNLNVNDKFGRLFKSNQSIYLVGDKFRYLMGKPNEEEKSFEFFINAIDAGSLLKRLLSYCNKERSHVEIGAFILSVANIELDYANYLIEGLIESQVLVNTSQPNIIGEDYYQRVASLDEPSILNNLKVEENASKITALELEGDDTTGFYLDEIVDSATDYYVNLEKELDAGTLNTAYQHIIDEAVDCLLQLTAVYSPGNKMADFIQAFKRKFDAQVIPLLFAIDPETGVDYDDLTGSGKENSLLSDIVWETKQKDAHGLPWSNVHSLLLKKGKIGTADACTIIIEDEDFATLKKQNTNIKLPPTASVVFRIIDEKVFIENAGGVTASALIGRFTPFNEQIRNLAKMVANEEQINHHGVIFADIGHICKYYTANINRRLNSYLYEIPVLATSLIADDNQIQLSDLWISVVNDEIILQSKKHGKRIIPRLSSAFNHSKNNLTVFRFLCDLQYQGLNSFWELDLGKFFPGMSHYPRVEYKKSILRLAEWHLKREQLERALNGDDNERCLRFNELKQTLKLPRYIALSVHDHQLVFDTNDTNDILFFLDTVKNESSFLVKEFIRENESIVKDHDGRPYINQFVAGLFHKQQVYAPVVSQIPKTITPQRNLMPGGEWLYFKLYCHPSRANEILVEKLSPLIQRLLASKAISKWFFIRYYDPGFHIRFRVKNSKGNYDKLFSKITAEINSIVKSKWISNYEVSIYERELERYDPVLIDDFENVFYHSSKLIVFYLANDALTIPMLDYDIFAFLTVRSLIKAFNLDKQQELEFLTQVCGRFSNEFKIEDNQKYRLDTKFREFRKRQNELVLTQSDLIDKICYGKENEDLIDSVAHIKSCIQKRPADMQLKWLSDIIHMHLNRLFIEDSRRQEYIIYFLLMKFEKAEFARNKAAGKGVI